MEVVLIFTFFATLSFIVIVRRNQQVEYVMNNPNYHKLWSKRYKNALIYTLQDPSVRAEVKKIIQEYEREQNR